MRRLGTVIIAMAMIAAGVGQAAASGGYYSFAYTVDRTGGLPQERARVFAGRTGMVLASAPEPWLYLQWRQLNGLEVGPAVGETLAVPCCDDPRGNWPYDAAGAWLEAAKAVPQATAPPDYISTELQGPDYTTIPNCFPDALDTATATLKNRIARFGRGSPFILAWLKTQQAVFKACGERDVVLPPAPAHSPPWLKADRAYQEAAFALYQGHNGEAATRFAAIANDRSSPWRRMAPYLAVRALHRHAIAHPTTAMFAATNKALDRLAAAPTGTYGQGEVRRMRRSLAYLYQPRELFAELDRELRQREPVPDLAAGLHDYLTLAPRFAPHADLVDWIETMRSENREAALDHAVRRWRDTHKQYWLLAALSLARPADPGTAALASDAARVGKEDPAWLTAQYHQIRLTLAQPDPAGLRNRLDSILGSGLSQSERNIFLALRGQIASGLGDFMGTAQRRAYCVDEDGFCPKTGWDAQRESGLALDRKRGGYVALGADARAILDRLSLPDRIAAASDPRLSAPLRLDLTLTNYGRAVQLQDDRAIDRTATALAGMMPQMRGDWQSIPARRPGPAKRFAELFVLAKIPGMSPYLADYTRPVGTVAQFHGDWWEWMLVPPGQRRGSADAPSPEAYNKESYPFGFRGKDADSDLSCFGKCGSGIAVLRLPAFVAAQQGQAGAQRTAFLFRNDEDERPAATFPPGTVSAWEALFAYAQANPGDPRAAEALYWLGRISRWGHSRDRLGYRAFRLLHTRHARSVWTERTPFYYD